MNIQSTDRTGSGKFTQLGMGGIGGSAGCIQPDLVAKVRSRIASSGAFAIVQFDAKVAAESMENPQTTSQDIIGFGVIWPI
ncbi:hypothetical protein A9Q94_04745 [Rhodobacterales bacterium 56_14_T64]|nr:hypothetical protein A9Q94_04745 [Rhodobacterales bacterium 56_14_T64]